MYEFERKSGGVLRTCYIHYGLKLFKWNRNLFGRSPRVFVRNAPDKSIEVGVSFIEFWEVVYYGTT